MRLTDIKNVMATFRRDVFAPMGYALPETPVYKTRARDWWACWDNNAGAYFYSYDDMPNTKAIIFHEMVHQWQDVYLPFYGDNLPSDYNPHDIYFWSWQPVAARLGLHYAEIF